MSSQSELRVLLSRQEIAATVTRLAAEIKRDYLNKRPLLIGILRGSFMFMADLVRRLYLPLEVEFARLSSYGKGTESSGKVRVRQGLRSLVTGRDVLFIEDIVDTGLTISYLMDYLRKKKPNSLKICATHWRHPLPFFAFWRCR